MNYSRMLNDLIPGGAHTYSRGDDQFPENAPSILTHGKGCHVFDPDGKCWLDYGMGLKAVSVGYAFDEIDEMAIAEIRKGVHMSRPSMTELKAAQMVRELIPCADMVKFGKNGSTVTSAAVKLARAYTGREMIGICAENSFVSYDDWFICSTPVMRGIPADIPEKTVKFHYNDLESVKKLFQENKGKIACLIFEPVNNIPPADNFLHKVKDLCHAEGAVFILDEMITGFRLHLNSAQTYFDVIPDLATFGKSMANGYPLAALTGKKEIMELGGILQEGEEKVFLISTTHGSEMISLGAFMATVEAYRKYNIISHFKDYGEKLMSGMNEISYRLGIQDFFFLNGYPCAPYYFTLGPDRKHSWEFRTLFLQEMVKHDILMPQIAISYSHTEKELDQTLTATEAVLKVYAQALDRGIDKYLEGKAVKPVFRKYI